jgi:hypothetical protein
LARNSLLGRVAASADNSANDGVEVQGSVDLFGQLSHYLGFSLPPGGFGIEVNILDSDRGLSGEQVEEIAILLGEVPSRVPIVEGDDAEKTAMIQQR